MDPKCNHKCPYKKVAEGDLSEEEAYVTKGEESGRLEDATLMALKWKKRP